MPTLILARHAHAAHSPGTTDFDRPLTGAGLAEARRAAAFLAAEAAAPVDYAVASAALRTRQTGGAVVEQAGVPGLELVADSGLYEAAVPAWLEVISTIPANSRCAYLVGHQPTVAATVLTLAPATALTAFRPSTLAVFELPGWDLAPGDYPVPRVLDFV
jgi:phosphohistidine phosphatase